MANSEKLDFNFRYRPKADSPDGILIRYLLSFEQTERKQLILKALRTFYLVAAYGELGELNDISSMKDFVDSLNKVYGSEYDDSHSLGIEIELNINHSNSFSTYFWNNHNDED